MAWDHFQTCTKYKPEITSRPVLSIRKIIKLRLVLCCTLQHVVCSFCCNGTVFHTFRTGIVLIDGPCHAGATTFLLIFFYQICFIQNVTLLRCMWLDVALGSIYMRIVCHMFGICMDFPQFYENSHDHHTDFCWQSICCCIYNKISLLLSCRSMWSFSANLVVKPFPHFVQTWGFFVDQFVSL